MRQVVLQGIVAVAAVVTVAPTTARQGPQDGPRIEGHWTLDEQKSDDARKKIADAFRTGGPGGGRGGFGGPERRGGGGRTGGGGAGTIIDGGGFGGGYPGALDPEAAAGLVRLLQGPTQLAIERTDSTVTLHRDDQPPLVLRLDGSPVTALAGDGGTLTMSWTAKWSGDRLTVEGQAERGAAIEEKYEVKGRDRPELRVEVKYTQGRGPTIKLKRVYTPAAPERA